jgi:hypothetical protein
MKNMLLFFSQCKRKKKQRPTANIKKYNKKNVMTVMIKKEKKK